MKPTTPLLAIAAALPVLLAVAPGPPSGVSGLCALGDADRSRTSARSCLTCHDGTVASGRMARAHEGGSGSHPVEVSYHLAHARRPNDFHAPAALPADLKLVEGKVTCTTCHDGRSDEHGKTALTMSRSAMCLACHDL